MMLAARDPEITGPVVINGAPMSYWSGSWSGGERKPDALCRGSAGRLLAVAADQRPGQRQVRRRPPRANFENLNPANTLWNKYYHLYANVDTEPERFLEFERWWGGSSLMNEEEIHWIVDNLFVGNRLARGEAGRTDSFIDLKAIRSPIIIFSSEGDNITPPQQALNWIADV